MKLVGQMQLMKIVYFSVFQFTWKCEIEFFPQLLHLMGDLRLAPPVDDKVRKVCSTHTTLTQHSHNTYTTLIQHSYNTYTTRLLD